LTLAVGSFRVVPSKWLVGMIQSLFLCCQLQDSVCFNGASCISYCDEIDTLTNSPVYTCSCLEGFEGRNCSIQVALTSFFLVDCLKTNPSWLTWPFRNCRAWWKKNRIWGWWSSSCPWWWAPCWPSSSAPSSSWWWPATSAPPAALTAPAARRCSVLASKWDKSWNLHPKNVSFKLYLDFIIYNFFFRFLIILPTIPPTTTTTVSAASAFSNIPDPFQFDQFYKRINVTN